MTVQEKKVQLLKEEFEKYGLREVDIEEKFIGGRGRGGQKVNKTSSTVYLKHIPSGIEIKCGEERERETNRFLARRYLLDRYKEEILDVKSARKIQSDKTKKQKKRRIRRSKANQK
jgi:protein subunit release factor B